MAKGKKPEAQPEATVSGLSDPEHELNPDVYRAPEPAPSADESEGETDGDEG